MARVLTGMMLGCCLVMTSPAHADQVLVFQRLTNDPQGADAFGDRAATVLQHAGHVVTLTLAPVRSTPTLAGIDQLPADLAPFDSIWIIGLGGISPLEETRLITFVRNGGGLYLSGEYNCQTGCSFHNTSITHLFSNILAQPVAVTTPTQSAMDGYTASALDPFRVTTTPNPVPTVHSVAPGRINPTAFGSVMRSQQHAVYLSSEMHVGAAAFAGEDLATGKEGSGCMLWMGDITFWASPVSSVDAGNPCTGPPLPADAGVDLECDRQRLVQNIQHFLSTCDDDDQDGLSTTGELALGTNPQDPDSDDDGLCDGMRVVSGVCLPGELLRGESVMDDVIGPLDPDDDNDGIPTRTELEAQQAYGTPDGDALDAWNDLDSDGDFSLDSREGAGDFDGDNIPAFMDADEGTQPCMNGACPSGYMCNTARDECWWDPAALPDAGTTTGMDASSPPDAATVMDAATADAAMTTDGAVDADAGSVDGATRPDAASVGDSGTGQDAAVTSGDAGAQGGNDGSVQGVDAGSSSGGGNGDPAGDGCGCQDTGASGRAWAAVLMLLVAARRQRRR